MFRSNISNKILIIAVLILLSAMAIGQSYIDPGLQKYINVGSLQSPFSAGGCERAYNNVYYEGLKWPAWYSYTDNHVIDRQWLVCKNYVNPGGTTFDYLGLYFSPSSLNPDYGFPMVLTQTAQFETPIVEVDFNQKIEEDYIDDYHDDGVSYDRKLVNVFNSYLGIEYTRTVYAYSQEYHDNYFITEYVLKNTGNTDYDADIELPNNSIEGLLFGMMPRYATSREVGFVTSGQMTWGKDQWVSFMNIDDVATSTYNPDSLRCFWTWFGQNSDISSAWDHIGGPDGGKGTLFNSRAGRLTGPQFAGMAFVHADKSATDKSDDISQPRTLSWHGGDSYPSVYGKSVSGSKNLYDMLTWASEYADAESGFGKGDTIPMVGPNAMRKPYGDEKPQADFEASKKNDGGGAAAMVAFGPYDLEIGESVRIVLIEAVSGLDRQNCVKVGENWLASKNLILPDGSTTTDRDEYKNEWFYTGRDSLFQTFKRARAAFRNDLVITEPPLPPSTFRINSEGDNIHLSWVDSPSEIDVNFGGYKIYRAMGSVDSFYHEIYACGAGTGNPIIYDYKDREAIRGFSYYYYITAFSDGSLNTDASLNPVGELESSRAYTQTKRAAYLRRPQGLDLQNIRIVPNPYNLKADSRKPNATQLQFPGADGYDKIMFYNIPGKCVLKIYSERGDLVKEINHQTGSGDEEWKITTSSGQIAVAGVYILFVEVSENIYVDGDPTKDLVYREGESIYKKFIIVR
ncbi:MAG: fibronectin [Candidatus Marinimicrobia bacterium]|nr:fibronectin [Candidatus Neomarinimicrobiota bacterium]